jgi:hypothetical protein
MCHGAVFAKQYSIKEWEDVSIRMHSHCQLQRHGSTWPGMCCQANNASGSNINMNISITLSTATLGA